MKKTKESIEKKRAKKKSDLEYSEKVKLKKKRFELSKRCDEVLEREYAKAERKSKARLNKKFLEYDRKCKNEIRKLEWKEEKVYKEKKKTLNIVEFAMELAQENSKLRDTDADGNGFCISCDKLCTWSELAWWHDYSRRIRNICLCLWNINAQCNGCNRTTWPRWDKIAAERVSRRYNENLAEKYNEGVVAQLREWYVSYFKNDYDENWVIGVIKKKKNAVEEYLIKTYIPELLDENEKRWESKNFYKPKKNWRKIYEQVLSLTK